MSYFWFSAYKVSCYCDIMVSNDMVWYQYNRVPGYIRKKLTINKYNHIYVLQNYILLQNHYKIISYYKTLSNAICLCRVDKTILEMKSDRYMGLLTSMCCIFKVFKINKLHLYNSLKMQRLNTFKRYFSS